MIPKIMYQDWLNIPLGVVRLPQWICRAVAPLSVYCKLYEGAVTLR